MKKTDVQTASGPTRRQMLQIGGGFGLALALPLGPGAMAQEGTSLRIAVPSDLSGWDHDYVAFDTVALSVMKNVYPFMIDYGVREVDGGRVGDTETVVPLYAESWTSNEDGTVWTLRLRQGILFPSGNELTAHDVKWSKDRAFAAQANVAGIYRIIGLTEADQVKVIDDYTVEFTQSTPSALTSQIQIISLYVYDSELLQENATEDDPWAQAYVNQTPQDGGAYNVSEYRPGEEIVLTANPNFPGEPPAVQTISLQVVPAPANRRLLLQNGDVDIALGLARRDAQDMAGVEGLTLLSSPNNEFVFVPMNMAMAPFDNAGVRKALAMAVPYEALIRSVYNGDARPLKSPVPIDMPGHSEIGYPFAYDVEAATAALAEAGYPDGFETSIVITSGDVDAERIAVLLQASFAAIGVTLEIETVDPATLQQRRRDRTVPLQVAAGQMWVNDVEYLLAVALTEGGFLNYANYSSDVVNGILASLQGELDTDTRMALITEAQEQLAEDVPWLCLAQPNFVLPISDRVGGWVQPVDGLFRLRYLTA
ncbi:ABC transporter substrate-binding protein [Roseisalinus antarcticus]|uniref:Heme-binding protein A n=1 Tax=Roseisalinus antarcticus TaxID=254357 RepID=A0A1Y5T0R9_9RHOB|nr:ABC transporter substrate-binding protein [Roseisalinus antarcticus]SLN53528.1 Heme-binding protein A precursor [Roseisalinus antarcticus]